MFHTSIQFHKTGILVLIVELALSPSEGFSHLQHKAGRLFYIRRMGSEAVSQIPAAQVCRAAFSMSF